MNLKKILILLLAAAMLLSCGCAVRIVEKPPVGRDGAGRLA